MKFKVGDRVRFVDDSDIRALKRGVEFEVSEVDNDGTLRVSGLGQWFLEESFELVADPPQETPTDPSPQDLSKSEQIREEAAEALAKVEAKRSSPRFVVVQLDDGWDVVDTTDGSVCPFIREEKARDNAQRMNANGCRDEGKIWWTKEKAEELRKGNSEVDPVNHPPHYTQHPSGIECIQVTEHMNFCRGNAVKYIWRAGEKGDAVEDLRKAVWYLTREIERIESKGGAT